MYDIALRQWKDKLVDPIAQMTPLYVGPGHVTFVAFTCGLLSCLAILSPTTHQSVALCLWLANRFLDCLDGAVARKRRLVTELGGFLDLLGDFVVYSLLPIAVARGQEGATTGSSARSDDDVVVVVDWLAVAFLEASFHINNFVLFYGAAVAAERRSEELTSVTMRPALVEGFESGLLFTAMLVWPRRINALSWLMGTAVTVGICQRVRAVIWVLRRALPSPKS